MKLTAAGALKKINRILHKMGEDERDEAVETLMSQYFDWRYGNRVQEIIDIIAAPRERVEQAARLQVAIEMLGNAYSVMMGVGSNGEILLRLVPAKAR